VFEKEEGPAGWRRREGGGSAEREGEENERGLNRISSPSLSGFAPSLSLSSLNRNPEP
jgi:hypothetical protein